MDNNLSRLLDTILEIVEDMEKEAQANDKVVVTEMDLVTEILITRELWKLKDKDLSEKLFKTLLAGKEHKVHVPIVDKEDTVVRGGWKIYLVDKSEIPPMPDHLKEMIENLQA